MSRLLEILGGGLSFDVAELIWNWLDVSRPSSSGGESASTSEAEGLDKVIELIKNRKTDIAADQLRLYLFENPDCPRGRMASAAIFISMGRLQDAIEQLNSVYLRQPSNTMALYALGHCYERLAKLPQAIEFYQDCLKFKNYLQLPRQRLAAIYFKNNQLEKATSEYELLRSEYPDDLWTLVTIGYLDIAVGRYAHAAQTFNTAILIHPDNFHIEDDNIDQLTDDNPPYQAAEQLEYQLAEHPERVDLLLKYADILAMLGATDHAIAQYQKLISIRPDCLEATVKLGTQFLHINDELSAAHQFNKAVEINDRIVDAYIGLATAGKLAGDTSGALTTLSLGAAIDANSAFLLAQTAALQFKPGFEDHFSPSDYLSHWPHLVKAVIAAHRRQIADQPQNPNLHYRLGILLMSLESFPEAIEAFRSALEINPTYFRARTKLAVCLFESGDQKSALEQLTAGPVLDNDTIQLHYKSALLYCDALRFASSLINLQQYMQDNFTDAYNVPNVAVVLENLGLLDRAAAMWDNLSETAAQAASNQ